MTQRTTDHPDTSRGRRCPRLSKHLAGAGVRVEHHGLRTAHSSGERLLRHSRRGARRVHGRDQARLPQAGPPVPPGREPRSGCAASGSRRSARPTRCSPTTRSGRSSTSAVTRTPTAAARARPVPARSSASRTSWTRSSAAGRPADHGRGPAPAPTPSCRSSSTFRDGLRRRRTDHGGHRCRLRDMCRRRYGGRDASADLRHVQRPR